ncbi:MAG: hypothetical protein ACP5P3_06280 [Ignavibacteria bacterium]
MRAGIILVLLILVSSAVSQTKNDKSEVDAKSFELYVAGKWDSLTIYCEDAISNGVDFYYLRMRAGIGYYELKKYLSAIPHFERALEFQPGDTIALEYLYYSYLFTNKTAKLNLLATLLPPSLRQKVHYLEPKFVAGSYVEGGYGINSNYDDTKTNFGKGGSQTVESQLIRNNSNYFSLNLLHSISERVSLFHGVSGLNISRTGQFFNKNKLQEVDLRTQQWNYYLTGGIYLGANFYTTLTMNLLFVNYEELLVLQSGSDFVAQKTSSSQNNYIFGLSLSKELGNITLGLSNSVSNMNNNNQRQSSLDVTLYPKSNLNLYLVSNFILHRNINTNNYAVERGLLRTKIGFKLLNKVWAELQYTFGTIVNYSEDNYYIVYNVEDKISNLAGVNLFFLLSDKVELLVRYSFYVQEVPKYTYNSNNILTNFFKEYNHNLIGGLKWTF